MLGNEESALGQKAAQSGSKIHFMANLSIAELHNLKYYLCKHIRRFVLALPEDRTDSRF